MSMSDPIADMLTRIRNALMAEKKTVSMPGSKVKTAIAKVLVDEGYLTSAELVQQENGKSSLDIELKYYNGKAVIEQLQRASKPGLRLYKGSQDIPTVWDGLGITIVSTSKGIMSDKEAKKVNQGGEVLCYVA